MTLLTAPPSPPLARASLDRLLRPRSVAIVGVSPSPTALGTHVLANLERAGFSGDIHLVNPKHAQIHGRACVATVDDLPDGIDCAVLAIPHDAILPVIAACARKRVGGAIVFSAGFAEAGETGRAEQAEIARIAREHGMIVEGPNCLGLVNYTDGIPLTFVEVAPTRPAIAPADRSAIAPAGQPAIAPADKSAIAIVSQSGAMACVLGVGLLARGLALSFSVSTGNEAASGVEDYVEYLLDDPATAVIALIVEQFRQPRRFLALAERARAAGKSLVLLHPGRSAAARESAATHTGAMAEDYGVMRVKVTHAGVTLVTKLEELLDVAELMARNAVPAGDGALVITESGAFKALTLDLCEAAGLSLPAPDAAGLESLRAVLPAFIPPSNPLDLTAQALVDPGLYGRTLEAALNDPRYGAIVFAIILTDPATCHLKFPPLLDALRRLRPGKPVILAGLDEGAEIPPEYVAALRELGIPFFATAERVFEALAILAARPRAIVRTAAPAPAAPAIAERGVIPEYKSKDILRQLGVRVPDSLLARTPDEAQAAAERIGYPVVLKAQSAELSHKSDVGGVILNLASPEAVAKGWTRLIANIAHHRPGLILDGVLVEGMSQRGTELIVGAHNDAAWGPVLLVGFGGVQAEALRDVRLLPPELSPAEIETEIRRLKSAALLDGFRGAPPLDVAAAAAIVARLGALVLANPAIAEADINPVMLYPRGQGAAALDALIVVR